MSVHIGRRSRPETGVWPWSARLALLLVPVVLLILLVTIVITKTVADWPSQRLEGWVLVAVVGLSLLPVILLLVQTLVTLGGTIRVAGLSLSFARVSEDVASALPTTTLAENLGTADDVPVTQTSLRSVLRALRRAHDSEVTIVDLRQGRTWWETRLFILVAGATRRDRPSAIAFIGDRNGQRGAYLGWAPPSRLLDMHVSVVPALSEAHARALSKASQWQIGTPGPPQPGTQPYVTLPWDNTRFCLPPMMDESPDPAFAFELFLQQDLDGRHEDLNRYVTIQRLLELYEPVLMTDRVDVDADDEAWARLLASNPRRYFALTAAGKFKALVPRDSLLAALVARLVEAGTQSARRRG
jgi:hypothetical protein